MRPRFLATGLLSNPPQPLSATINATSGVWSVQFDSDLVPGGLDAANWTIRANDTAYDVVAASANDAQVVGASNAGDENIGADVISYSPPPFDVVESVNNLPAAAFADFPLTVT